MTATHRRTTAPKGWSGQGVDTETYRGWARLICTDRGVCWLKRGDWRRAFAFLINQGPSLVAWNLRFDAEAILKHLPEDGLRRLFLLEHLNLPDGYTLELVPWKMLRIRWQRESTEIFDVAPFFGGRLDAAARRFLGEGKKKMDAAALNTDPDAWKARAKIVEYCQHDARITNRLADMVSARYVKLGGSFHKPYSAAYVAADMLLRDTAVPRLAHHIVPISEEAFHGARFECPQRGRFPDLVAYDIKSAYPAELVKLEDAPGRWVTGRRPHRDALQAVIKCVASVDPDEYPILAPLPVARRGRPTIYPTGTFETYVLKRTYEKFEDILTPVASKSLIPLGEPFKPYAKTVERLVAFRSSADEMLGDSAKRAANSVYGKLLNIKTGRELVEDPQADHFGNQVVVLDGVPHRVIRRRNPGLLYNPLHGGIVTEGTRLTIWDAVQGHQDRVVGIQADGILADGPILGTEKAKKMGDLGFVARGDGVSCGSGLYEIKGYARRTRGVMLGALGGNKGGKSKRMKGKGWFSLLRGKKTEAVQFTDTRPAHLSECLRGGQWSTEAGDVRTLGLKDANVFLPFTRNLNVCRDEKRVWPDIQEARRLLSEQFTSRPIHLNTAAP